MWTFLIRQKYDLNLSADSKALMDRLQTHITAIPRGSNILESWNNEGRERQTVCCGEKRAEREGRSTLICPPIGCGSPCHVDMGA